MIGEIMMSHHNDDGDNADANGKLMALMHGTHHQMHHIPEAANNGSASTTAVTTPKVAQPKAKGRAAHHTTHNVVHSALTYNLVGAHAETQVAGETRGVTTLIDNIANVIPSTLARVAVKGRVETAIDIATVIGLIWVLQQGISSAWRLGNVPSLATANDTQA